jgi:hypothetical protein
MENLMNLDVTCLSKKLTDGRILDVYPLIFGRARVGIRLPGSKCYENEY